jgi:hypothetical protein
MSYGSKPKKDKRKISKRGEPLYRRLVPCGKHCGCDDMIFKGVIFSEPVADV